MGAWGGGGEGGGAGRRAPPGGQERRGPGGRAVELRLERCIRSSPGLRAPQCQVPSCISPAFISVQPTPRGIFTGVRTWAGGGGMLCADSALMSPDPRFSLERWLGRELEFQPERGWQERVRFFLEKLVLCTYHSAAERGISSALYP